MTPVVYSRTRPLRLVGLRPDQLEAIRAERPSRWRAPPGTPTRLMVQWPGPDLPSRETLLADGRVVVCSRILGQVYVDMTPFDLSPSEVFGCGDDVWLQFVAEPEDPVEREALIAEVEALRDR